MPESWRLVFCYGAFGLGYIIPATFLPVMARAIIPDPRWFGWAWPAFGAAAMVSTLLAGRIKNQRRVWMWANLVMAIGVLLPVALPGLGAIVAAAVCVGGTFMVMTMAGLQEARRVAGADAKKLMGAMTAAFALGQVAGPLLAALLATHIALVIAALPLLVASWLLKDAHGSHAAVAPARPE